MKTILPAALLLAALRAGAADAPRAQLRAGWRDYDAKRYESALQQFEGAAAGAATNRLDAAVPLYNAANALMQLGRAEEASRQYQQALRSPDLALQGRAYYNRGNALYRVAEASAHSPAQALPQAAAPTASEPPPAGLDTAGQAVEESLKMYERAIFLDPADEDAKANYELALRLKERIQQMQQQQQQNQQQEQKKDQPPPQEKKDEEQDQGQKQDPQPKQEQPQEQEQKQDQASKPEDQPAEQMTPEEARMLLDRMKQEEQSYRDKMQVIMGRPVPVDKDW